MKNRQITIRMPKAKLAKWLKALRKGGYAQATGVLYDKRNQSFCCLGVLQHCLSRGSVEVSANGEFRDIPSLEWLAENGIQFSGEYVPTDNRPFLPSLRADAARANDRGVSFAELADAIEACAEGV